ncbi:hypothetical protein ABC383_21955 [Noviherbaspirillum sp. 1P10PC]|uniref:hypothetical protein n=1 Tax=Noviherbaspirillum sp. 1P10PC TaxID=3132292 RepID=UPI0039A211E6
MDLSATSVSWASVHRQGWQVQAPDLLVARMDLALTHLTAAALERFIVQRQSADPLMRCVVS